MKKIDISGLQLKEAMDEGEFDEDEDDEYDYDDDDDETVSGGGQQG